MGGKAKAPPPVDYAAAAAAQGDASKATSLQDWLLSNVNQTTPYGTRSVVADPKSASGYTETTTLDPSDQAQLDMSRKLQTQLLGVGGNTIQQVSDNLSKPIDMSGLPALTGSVNAGKMLQGGINGPTNFQTALDTSGVTQNLNDPTALRQQMTDAAYKNFSDRFDPLAQQQQNALTARIANMGGVTTGTAAQQMMKSLLQNQNDARTNAIYGAQTTGEDTASKISAQQLANRGEQYGEATGTMGANNAALQSALGFNNAAMQQDTQNALANANLGNSARAQGLNEQQSLRDIPLNELMSMLSGTQVQAPTFQGVAGSQTNAAPIFGAAQAQGQANAATNAANAASGNSFMSGLGTMGAAAITAF